MEKFEKLPPRFTIKDVNIIDKKRSFQGFFAIDTYTLEHKKFDGSKSEVLKREIFERDADAVAILPYDQNTDEVLLIEQFRPGALKDEVSPWLYEVVAGMIDKGEDMYQAAIRELNEESRLTVKKEDLKFLNTVYPTPGGASERVSLFIAYVKLDHIQAHGGLESEHEDIRIFKLKRSHAIELIKNGVINNAATIISLFYLQSMQAR